MSERQGLEVRLWLSAGRYRTPDPAIVLKGVQRVRISRSGHLHLTLRNRMRIRYGRAEWESYMAFNDRQPFAACDPAATVTRP
jgi:hypothetical protein